MMATQRYALSSADLKDVTAMQGKIQLIKEEGIHSGNADTPALYKRSFKMDSIQILHGKAHIPKDPGTVSFFGFTQLSPLQRSGDFRLPVLNLDGQEFFDLRLPSEPFNGLIFVGGADLPSIQGFMGNKAMIEAGELKGNVVRAFILEGANISLSTEIQSLVGWQNGITADKIDLVNRTTHPLIALDALRISIQNKWADKIEFLVRWLLHPVYPAIVQKACIELLQATLSDYGKGSNELGKLVNALIDSWEMEQFNSINRTYADTFLSVIDKLADKHQLEKLKALSNAHRETEIDDLIKKLQN